LRYKNPNNPEIKEAKVHTIATNAANPAAKLNM